MSKQATALRMDYDAELTDEPAAAPDPISPGKRTSTQDNRGRGPHLIESRLAALRDRQLPALRAAIESHDLDGARSAARLVRMLLLQLETQLASAPETDRPRLTAARDALLAEAEPVLALAPPAVDPDDAVDESNRGAWVQRLATRPDVPAETHAHAHAGVAGTGAALPHLAAIQASFGAHDISGIRAHVGGPAAQASAAIGAEAYATGNNVAFAQSPSLFVAAHEAAHVVQQRAGVSLLGGVGEVGDTYEQHADAVAEKVVRGESAEGLLGEAKSQSSAAAIQLKAKPEKTFLLLSLDAIAATAVDALDRIDEYQEDGESALATDRHTETTSQDALGRILDRLSNLRDLVPDTREKKLVRAAKNAAAAFLALAEVATKAGVDVSIERGAAEATFAALGVPFDGLKADPGHARFTSKERRQTVTAALEAAISRISQAHKHEPTRDLDAATALISQAESDLRDGKVPGAKKLAKKLSTETSNYVAWSGTVSLPEGAQESLALVQAALDGVRARCGLGSLDSTQTPSPAVRVTAHETPKTGIAVVDGGTVCEQDAASNECFLSYEARTRVLDVLGDVVESSLDNYGSALQRAQLDLVLAKEGSWDAFSEILFFAVTGPLIGVAVKAVKTAKAAIAAKKAVDVLDLLQGKNENDVGAVLNAISKVPDGVLQEGLQLSSKGLRQHLKNASRAGGDNNGQAAFLKIVEEQIKPMKDSLKIDVPATLTDAGLVAMYSAYRDADAHSIASYEAKVNEVLARYHSESVDRVGEEFEDGGKVRPIVLEAYGRRRPAMLAEHGTGYVGMHGYGEVRGEFKFGDDVDYFLSFIDDDLAPMAAGIYEAKTGGTPETIHVTEDGYPFSFAKGKQDEVAAWVRASKAAPGASNTAEPSTSQDESKKPADNWQEPGSPEHVNEWNGNHF